MAATTGPNAGLWSGWVDNEDGWGDHMNSNLELADALLDPGVIHVMAAPYGAVGDDVTDDTSAIADAITDAEVTGKKVMFRAGHAFRVTSGFTIKRSTVIEGYGATLHLDASSGTLITVGSDADGSLKPGGIFGLCLAGQGGSSDTSIGLQLGNSTYLAQSFVVKNSQIAYFGHGVVLAGSGHIDGSVFDNVRIILNAYNGVRIDVTFAVEMIVLKDCVLYQNGVSQAAGAAIQLTSGASVSLALQNCVINSNGDGTLAQIYSPTTAAMYLRMHRVDMESSNTTARQHIVLEGNVTIRDRVLMTECVLGVYNCTTNKTQMAFGSADVWCTDCRFVQTCTGTIVPVIDLGRSRSSIYNTLRMRGTYWDPQGTVANFQALAVTGTGLLSFVDIAGSTLSNSSTATNLIAIDPECEISHDLFNPASDVGMWAGLAMTRMRLLWNQDNRKAVDFNLDSLTLTGSGLYTLKVMCADSKVGVALPIIATADLPAAGTDYDGLVCIEDAGAGDRNLIVYSNGERFRIDGGAAF